MNKPLTSWQRTLRALGYKVNWRNGYSKQRRSYKKPKFHFENLEPRKMLASVTFDNGQLAVAGTQGDNTIVLTVLATNEVEVEIDGVIVATENAEEVESIIINGLAGNDVIDLSQSDFSSTSPAIEITVRAGDGDDTIFGSPLDDSIYGDDGNDEIYGGGGNDFLVGGGWAIGDVNRDGQVNFSDIASFTDLLSTGNYEFEADINQDDVVSFLDIQPFIALLQDPPAPLNDGNDLIHGGGGNDTIHGNDGDDTLLGNEGDDVISGDLGSDSIYGGDDGDTIDGGGGNDFLLGGDGIVGDVNRDGQVDFSDIQPFINVLSGGVYQFEADADQNGSVDFLDIQPFIPLLSNAPAAVGNDGDDFITGGTGADVLRGGIGNDTYLFSGTEDLGIDTVNEFAGEGVDSLDFSDFGSAVTIDLNSTETEQVSQTNVVETNNLLLSALADQEIENIVGTIFNDDLTGNSLDNTIYGGQGRDTIRGGLGLDTLFGDDGDGGDGTPDLGVVGPSSGTVVLGTPSLPVATALSAAFGDQPGVVSPGVGVFGDLNGPANSPGLQIQYQRVTDLSESLIVTLPSTATDFNFTFDRLFENEGGAGNDEQGQWFAFLGGQLQATGIFVADSASTPGVQLAGTVAVGAAQLGGAIFDTVVFQATEFSLFPSDANNSDASDYFLTSFQATLGQGFVGNSDDSIFGGEGNDIIRGESGNDFIEGGNGNDEIFGGFGGDQIFGQNGNDRLNGDAGNDRITGGDGEDIIRGGDDNDVIEGGGTSFLANGGIGDLDVSNNIDDDIEGGDGDDYLAGGNGNDVLLGEAGDDALFGQAGADELRGGTGADYLVGGLGDDQIFGDADADFLAGGRGVDSIVGGTPSFPSNTDANGVIFDVQHSTPAFGGRIFHEITITIQSAFSNIGVANGGRISLIDNGQQIFLTPVITESEFVPVTTFTYTFDAAADEAFNANARHFLEAGTFTVSGVSNSRVFSVFNLDLSNSNEGAIFRDGEFLDNVVDATFSVTEVGTSSVQLTFRPGLGDVITQTPDSDIFVLLENHDVITLSAPTITANPFNDDVTYTYSLGSAGLQPLIPAGGNTVTAIGAYDVVIPEGAFTISRPADDDTYFIQNGLTRFRKGLTTVPLSNTFSGSLIDLPRTSPPNFGLLAFSQDPGEFSIRFSAFASDFFYNGDIISAAFSPATVTITPGNSNHPLFGQIITLAPDSRGLESANLFLTSFNYSFDDNTGAFEPYVVTVLPGDFQNQGTPVTPFTEVVFL